MPGRRGRRTWIKLWCYERLHGSVSYQLTEEEQSVWDKLLCFAGLCGLDGRICDSDLRPLPHDFIAHELHTSLELLENTLEKCKQEGRIIEDSTGIKITNWEAYQSEYARQKRYRKGYQDEELELERAFADGEIEVEEYRRRKALLERRKRRGSGPEARR